MITFSPKHILLTLFLIFGIVFSSTTAAYAINRLGWSAEQAEAWQHMRATNHPYYQDLKAQADKAGLYNDDGLRDGMMYLITGDAQYATRAWNHVSWYRGRSYNPGGVSPKRNSTRDRFLAMSRLFSWIADGLSAEDKANFRDVLDHWADKVFNGSHGTRPWDSDEMTGHYFGLVVYALAIKDEDPARSNELLNQDGLKYSPAVGGVDSTGENWSTWRNTLRNYATKADGGQWMESSMYNLNSARYLLYGISAINGFYGKEKFPEFAPLIQEFADAMLNELTPDFKDSFQWGDVQTGNLHNLTLYSRLGFMSVIAGLSKDKHARYVLNTLYERNASTPEGHVFPFLSAEAPFASPSGVSFHNANGRGVAFHHSGWKPNDSFFASTFLNEINIDHEGEALANFNLYRNGAWAITNPRGYYGSQIEAPYMNGMLINGAVTVTKEARGASAFEAGEKYLYHAGLTGGITARNNYDDPPLEFINEYSRGHLYLHNDDGSDTIVVFDRIKSQDPREAMSGWKFGRFPDVVQNRVKAVDGYHQWILHMPEAPSISGNQATWVSAGGENVQLKMFDEDLTTKVYDEKALHNAGAPLFLGGYMDDSELKYQMRLVPNQKNGFLSLLNVLHVGGQLKASELQASAGDQARGVYLQPGTQNIAVIFNGTEGETIEPTPCCDADYGWASQHDPKRFDKIDQLRKFKNGFSMSINSDGYTQVYLMDLDPAKTWTAEVAGNEIPLSVSQEGVSRFDYLESGVHVLTVTHSGISNQPPAAVIDSPQFDGLVASFGGSKSFDPEGEPLTYTWDFGDGQTSTEMNPTHTYSHSGEYTVTLTVSDGVYTSEEALKFTIGEVNDPPVINDIADQSLEAGKTLSLEISAHDKDDDTLFLSVTLGGGDSIETIEADFTDYGNGTGLFTFTPNSDQVGDYVLTFQATDGTVNTTENVFIEVQAAEVVGSLDVIEFEAESGQLNAPFVTQNDKTAFGGSFIVVPDAGNFYGDAHTTKMAVYEITITEPGAYILFARVRTPANNGTDDSFFVQMDDQAVSLWDTNVDPRWNWDKVSNRNGADPVIFNLSEGVHTLKVKLREDGTELDRLVLTNNHDYVPTNYVPLPQNEAPVAKFDTSNVDGMTIAFDGSASDDPDGDSLTYNYDFGDGSTSDSMSPSHTYAEAGQYEVTLSVSDGELAATSSQMVQITKPNTPPILSSIPDQTTEVDAPLSVIFDGSDEDGDVLTFGVSGLENSALNKKTSTSAEFTFKPDSAQEGVHPVVVTLSDGTDEVSITFNITVKPKVVKNEYHWIEAEFPDSVRRPFTVKDDSTASQGAYLYTPNGSGNIIPGVVATYKVNVSQSGEYYLFGRVSVTNDRDDSFFVQIDDQPERLWDTPYGPSWHWAQVNDRGQIVRSQAKFTLSQGEHIIKVRLREDGTKLDKILLTNDLAFMPSGVGQTAQNVPDEPIVKEEFHWLEAEFPNVINAPFAVANNSDASEGKMVGAANGSGNFYNSPGVGVVSFTVVVEQAGDYRLWTRTQASSGSDDSFFIQMNNGSNHIFDVAWSNSPAWNAATSRDIGGNVLTFRLDAGVNTIKVKLREDGTFLDKMLLTNDLEFIPGGLGEKASNITKAPDDVKDTTVKLTIEAEDGKLVGPFVVNSEGSASGGKYIVVPNGTGNYNNSPGEYMAEFTVNVSHDGEYFLFGKTQTKSGTEDSFWVQVDHGQNFLWDTSHSSNWEYDRVSDRNLGHVSFNLSAGTHTIKVKLREDGTKLDQLILTNDLGLMP